jgi:hypothetical protein
VHHGGVEIILYADYAPWPLWSNRGLLDEGALPLSMALKTRMKAWLNAYSHSPRPDWPLWVASSVDEDEAEAEWVAEGNFIRGLIAAELGPGFNVRFDT